MHPLFFLRSSGDLRQLIRVEQLESGRSVVDHLEDALAVGPEDHLLEGSHAGLDELTKLRPFLCRRKL